MVPRRCFRRRRSPAAPPLAAFFTDEAFNLHALATSGDLAVDITLTVETDAPGAYFTGEFILGDPPAGGLHGASDASPWPAAPTHWRFG